MTEKRSPAGAFENPKLAEALAALKDGLEDDADPLYDAWRRRKAKEAQARSGRGPSALAFDSEAVTARPPETTPVGEPDPMAITPSVASHTSGPPDAVASPIASGIAPRGEHGAASAIGVGALRTEPEPLRRIDTDPGLPAPPPRFETVPGLSSEPGATARSSPPLRCPSVPPPPPSGGLAAALLPSVPRAVATNPYGAGFGSELGVEPSEHESWSPALPPVEPRPLNEASNPAARAPFSRPRAGTSSSLGDPGGASPGEDVEARPVTRTDPSPSQDTWEESEIATAPVWSLVGTVECKPGTPPSALPGLASLPGFSLTLECKPTTPEVSGAGPRSAAASSRSAGAAGPEPRPAARARAALPTTAEPLLSEEITPQLPGGREVLGPDENAEAQRSAEVADELAAEAGGEVARGEVREHEREGASSGGKAAWDPWESFSNEPTRSARARGRRGQRDGGSGSRISFDTLRVPVVFYRVFPRWALLVLSAAVVFALSATAFHFVHRWAQGASVDDAPEITITTVRADQVPSPSAPKGSPASPVSGPPAPAPPASVLSPEPASPAPVGAPLGPTASALALAPSAASPSPKVSARPVAAPRASGASNERATGTAPSPTSPANRLPFEGKTF